MTAETIGIVSAGDMGSGVGAALVGRGFRVVTALDGRSERTRALAARAGMADVGTLDAVMAAADTVLSILPPARAGEFARAAVTAMERANRRPAFVDCNAIAPATVRAIAEDVASVAASFADVGIIGLPPGRAKATRFYASGPAVDRVSALAGDDLIVHAVGPEVGRASAIKMCYASMTKGTFSLQTAVLIAAERLGVSAEVRAEFADSQAAALAAMERRVPFVAADADRWIGEMEEIAATYAAAGLTPKYHEAAAEMFRLLAASPLGAETRETADRTRTLDEAVRIYTETLAKASV